VHTVSKKMAKTQGNKSRPKGHIDRAKLVAILFLALAARINIAVNVY
jgi:hypothetical protein